MEQKRIPKPGEIYNHFKDRLYQIITVAQNTETDELMVVYQALYGDFKTYVRPLTMFLSEVDRTKYPKVKQKYRFELRRTSDGELVEQMTAEEKHPNREPAKQTEAEHPDREPVEQIKTERPDREPVEQIKTERPDRELVKQAAESQLQELDKNTSSNSQITLPKADNVPEEAISELLIRFLDAKTYNKKLEILTSNTKHLNDRLINDMAVALDCTVDEGPLDQRIQELIHCLQAMRRFEDRRLR